MFISANITFYFKCSKTLSQSYSRFSFHGFKFKYYKYSVEIIEGRTSRQVFLRSIFYLIKILFTEFWFNFLFRMINQKNSALNATNLCYTAVLYFIYENWRKEKLTLADCGPVLKSKTQFNCCLNMVFNSSCTILNIINRGRDYLQK